MVISSQAVIDLWKVMQSEMIRPEEAGEMGLTDLWDCYESDPFCAKGSDHDSPN